MVFLSRGKSKKTCYALSNAEKVLAKQINESINQVFVTLPTIKYFDRLPFFLL